METKLILKRMALVASLTLSVGLNAMQQPTTTTETTTTTTAATDATASANAPTTAPKSSWISTFSMPKPGMKETGVGIAAVVLPVAGYYAPASTTVRGYNIPVKDIVTVHAVNGAKYAGNGIMDAAKYAGNGIAGAAKYAGNGIAGAAKSGYNYFVAAKPAVKVVNANPTPRLAAFFGKKQPEVKPGMLSLESAKNGALWLSDKTLGAMYRNPRTSGAVTAAVVALGVAYKYDVHSSVYNKLFKSASASTPATTPAPAAANGAAVAPTTVAQFDALIRAYEIATNKDSTNLENARDNKAVINEQSLVVSTVDISVLNGDVKTAVTAGINAIQAEYAKLRADYLAGKKSSRLTHKRLVATTHAALTTARAAIAQ